MPVFNKGNSFPRSPICDLYMYLIARVARDKPEHPNLALKQLFDLPFPNNQLNYKETVESMDNCTG